MMFECSRGWRGLNRQHWLSFSTLRHAFQAQPDLPITPSEKIRLPLKRRDELPPLLAGLQWIWRHPTLKAESFALLAAKILAGEQATGRTGMDLWQSLVLGVVRLGLDADWDRLEHVAHDDLLVRQMLGVPAMPWGAAAQGFGHQTLRDNGALLEDQLRQQINARIAAAGREGFEKKAGAPGAALEVKVDSDVLESDVPFATRKHPKVLRWLGQRPRFHLHFTPTRASWLNLVERFFRDLSQDVVLPGSFASVGKLGDSIWAYLAERNLKPQRYEWRAEGKAILEKIRHARAALASQASIMKDTSGSLH